MSSHIAIEKNRKSNNLKKSEGWFDESNSKSDELVSTYLYNEKHEIVGKCYSFKNGKIDKIVMYEKIMGKICVKEFKECKSTGFDENKRKEHEGGKWVKGSGEVVEYDGGKKEVNDLKVIIRSERDWKSLNKEVIELVIDEGVCNDMNGDLVIEELNGLKSIVVKKNSLKNLSSLKIRNCKLLEKIEMKGDCSYEEGSFWNVKNVEISSLFYF